jgi:hypothetical protein
VKYKLDFCAEIVPIVPVVCDVRSFRDLVEQGITVNLADSDGKYNPCVQRLVFLNILAHDRSCQNQVFRSGGAAQAGVVTTGAKAQKDCSFPQGHLPFLKMQHIDSINS